MILIADSGSTKCDWAVYKNNCEHTRKRTQGLNPSILSDKIINAILTDLASDFKSIKNNISIVYFFGAGCNTSKSKQKISRLLQLTFKNANIIVEEDIVAAVRATTKSPAVVCILGTGSNCCFFDGKDVHKKIPSLGYILMDEGSGNYFGKELLKSYFYNDMPLDLKVLFKQSFNLKPQIVSENLYKLGTPNKYLAHFAPFLFENYQHPFIKNILIKGFATFIEEHLMCYREELKSFPLHFVGSIAFNAQDIIIKILNNKGLHARCFIKNPIDNLSKILKNENILN